MQCGGSGEQRAILGYLEAFCTGLIARLAAVDILRSSGTMKVYRGRYPVPGSIFVSGLLCIYNLAFWELSSGGH